jgi:hypothetical protein
VQNARDTFYVMLRDRVAAGNDGRTVVIRGAVRPGVLVVENELPSTVADVFLQADTFCLQWTELKVDGNGPLPLVTATCEIRYGTSGSTGTAGMDRGRKLAALDGELALALGAEPQTVVKTNYTTGSSVAMSTNVFWGAPVFGAMKVNAERLERTVAVAVYSYQEAGEV